MKRELVNILACPVCKGTLELRAGYQKAREALLARNLDMQAVEIARLNLMLRCLEKTGGNKRQAARLLRK